MLGKMVLYTTLTSTLSFSKLIHATAVCSDSCGFRQQVISTRALSRELQLCRMYSLQREATNHSCSDGV